MNKVADLNSIVLYQNETGSKIIEVLYDSEDFWLTQKTMAELFSVKVNTINYHLKEIFNSGELEEDSVIRKIRITANDGKKYNTSFYSLDAIIAVGYRVNSFEATQFRIWATNTLKEYIKKGFVVNSELLKNGPKFGKDYFDELLLKIKEIRASERRFYQKITDIYKECSYDYDKNSKTTIEFYKNVQNKLHFAITGMTAPEIIYNRADASKEHMGLTSWTDAPDGKIMKSDAVIAKNYLSEQEIYSLRRIVSAYLDLAESRAERHIPMTMEDWSNRLDEFLKLTDREILQDAGKISHKIACDKAESEFEKYRIVQDQLYISDFDKYIDELEKL